MTTQAAQDGRDPPSKDQADQAKRGMEHGLCGGPAGQRHEVSYADHCRCLQQASAGDRSGSALAKRTCGRRLINWSRTGVLLNIILSIMAVNFRGSCSIFGLTITKRGSTSVVLENRRTIATLRRLTDHSGTSALTCIGLKRWKKPKRSSKTGGGTTMRVGLARLSTTCRQLNLYAGRAFQALSRFNQRRKLTLRMALETQADQVADSLLIGLFKFPGPLLYGSNRGVRVSSAGHIRLRD